MTKTEEAGVGTDNLVLTGQTLAIAATDIFLLKDLKMLIAFSNGQLYKWSFSADNVNTTEQI